MFLSFLAWSYRSLHKESWFCFCSSFSWHCTNSAAMCLMHKLHHQVLYYRPRMLQSYATCSHWSFGTLFPHFQVWPMMDEWMFRILNQSLTTFEMWIPFEGLCSTCSFITKGSFKHTVSHRSHLLWLKQNMMQILCCLRCVISLG